MKEASHKGDTDKEKDEDENEEEDINDSSWSDIDGFYCCYGICNSRCL